MAIKATQVENNLRVKFVPGYEPTSLAQTHLASEEYATTVLPVFNDAYGEYVILRGSSGISRSYGYLKDLILVD